MQAADPEQGQGIPDVQPMGVLLFGDSVDFRFLKFFCEFALEQEPKPFTVSESDWLKLQGERHPNVSSVCCSILTAFISGRIRKRNMVHRTHSSTLGSINHMP